MYQVGGAISLIMFSMTDSTLSVAGSKFTNSDRFRFRGGSPGRIWNRQCSRSNNTRRRRKGRRRRKRRRRGRWKNAHLAWICNHINRWVESSADQRTTDGMRIPDGNPERIPGRERRWLAVIYLRRRCLIGANIQLVVSEGQIDHLLLDRSEILRRFCSSAPVICHLVSRSTW